MVNIKERVEEWLENIEKTKLIKREFQIPETSDIKAIVGPRRAGKTYYLFQLAKKFFKEKEVVYINFDDIFFSKAKVEEWKLFFKKLEKNTLLLLDEVQNWQEWGKWLRTLHDENKFDIYITGSTSKLLIKEVSTNLRGRYISKLFLPLSFREFLKIKESTAGRRELDEYLKYGGFPEVIKEGAINKEEKLRSIFTTTFYRDFVERYRTKEIETAKVVIEDIISATASSLSISKLHRKLRNLGIMLSKRTLWKYYNQMKESFLFFDIPSLVFSKYKERVLPRKVYSIDLGISNIFRAIPLGAKIETAVAHELLRKGKGSLYYILSHNYEIDFAIRSNSSVELMEVAAIVDNTHIKKLEDSTKYLPKFLKINRLSIINLEEELKSQNIEIKPLVKWLSKK